MYPGQCPVYWHTGLFLQPQHLQSMDLHQQWLSEEYARLHSPWHYGTGEWSLNESVLKNGGILFEKLSVVMPGGTLLRVPENCTIKKRNISGIWVNKDQPLNIWLMIKLFDPHNANVVYDVGPEGPAEYRWVTWTEEREMPDMYQKDAPSASVTYLKYSACLMTDEEKKDATDFEGIRLMRLCYQGGEIVMDPAYSPPALFLAGSPVLSRWAVSCHAQITALATRLSELCCDGKSFRHYDRMTLQLFKLVLLRTLCVLTRYLQTPQLSPWYWFCQLEQCLAELRACGSAYPSGVSEPVRYDHSDPLAGLETLYSAIMQWGTELRRPESIRITFSPAPEGGDRYVADVSALSGNRCSPVWLVLDVPGMDSQWHPVPAGQVKLAADRRIDSIVQHSLRGVGLHPARHLPAGETVSPGPVYFEVDQNDALWKEIVLSGRAVIYWPGVSDNAVVSLITEPENEHIN